MKQNMLSPQNAVILIIDPQEKLLPKVFEPERVTDNIILLVKLAYIMGLPLIVTTQYAKGIGPIVERIREKLSEQSFLDKVEFGCFNNKVFTEHVGQLAGSKDTLVLAGIESHICVMQTALGALEHGYAVHVASDAISSRTEWNWKTGLERMKTAGVIISSTEMVIYEILKRSDSAQFKEILPDLRNSAT